MKLNINKSFLMSLDWAIAETEEENINDGKHAYLIMSENTANLLYDICMHDINETYKNFIVLNNPKRVTYKGHSIAICDNLKYGEIEIR